MTYIYPCEKENLHLARIDSFKRAYSLIVIMDYLNASFL